MTRLALPAEWRSRALVIAETSLDEAWFTDEELAIAGGFRLPKRRREWMLSRYAAKMLAIEQGICAQPREFSMAAGTPAAAGGKLFLSISHSTPFAAAALAEGPVGIDVQHLREINESAGHLFLSDREQRAMRGVSVDHRLLHFWCAKEAAWKQLGGATGTLKKLPLILEGEGPQGLQFDRVETVRSGDAVIALTRPIS